VYVRLRSRPRVSARILLSPPHMGDEERELLLDAFDSNWIAPLGPHVDAFERELAAKVGVPHAAAVSSGTAALHLSLHMLGVRAGSDVLVPTLTFVATANAVAYLGARPVFVDSDPQTWTMDVGIVAEELEERARRGQLPKAVVAVDLYGQCANYDPLLEACSRFGVPVVEDAAEALGATYKGRAAGSFGSFGVFSFNGNKVITTSGGGMIVTESQGLAQRARFLSTQARDPGAAHEHSEIGFNYRLSNLLAAVGRGQLRNLDDRVQRRRFNNDYYRQALANVSGIDFMPDAAYGESLWWLTCITVDPNAFGASSEDVRVRLEELNIESRPLWKPLHTQPAFARADHRGGDVASWLFARGLCLPSGSSLTTADLDRVVEGVLSVRPGRV
jgi:dTDP-4-amino-4,6-dideoxygalactose transaminase